jgi:cytochrome c oxidase cbb3-type subunit 3
MKSSIQQFMLAFCLAAASAAAQAQSDRGADLYKVYCTQCHGVNADGKGLNAPHMSVQPRDHTDTKEMSARTDEELFKVIKQGGKSINKSVLMPIWGGNLSDDDINALVAHLRQLCCSKN